jgi:pyruvate dehydrogenase (quinone)
MSTKVSDFLLQRLAEWGVKRLYGYPGDGINGILGALERNSELIDFVQVRHEEMAAFMACAHAKFTGEVGVCLATSGPGAIHLLNGLYDARLDHQPVVAIVGQSARSAIGGHYQQEVDLPSLFKDVAGEYVQTVMDATQLRQVVDRAMRIAQVERTVTCVILPKDVQNLDAVTDPPHKHNTVHTGIGFASTRITPAQEDLQRAADVLNAGNKVAILVGAGALGASTEVMQVAELLGAGVAKALLGKAVLPDDLPYVTGSIGLLGTRPSWNMMNECDTLLMIGSSFPYGEFLPKEGQARGVQIDIDGRMLSLRYPMEVNLIGDSQQALRALIPLLQQKSDRSWRAKIEQDIRNWWDVVEKQAHNPANPINPQLVAWELSANLPDLCIVTADAGTSANWYGRDIKFRTGMLGSLSGSLATMGAAVPYAIAAKFAYPDRVPVCFTGDGAMQMNGLNELITVAKYRERWRDQRIVFVVLNNRDLNQVTWEMRTEEGNPKLPATQTLPDFPYARFAESIGLRGIRVERPEQVASSIAAAFSSSVPVVLEAYTDPEVPTLPPHITFEQAKNYASALLKGDPDEVGIIRQSAKSTAESFAGVVRDMLPHHDK